MRPRKVVLCLAGSESRLAERVFLLWTRGYDVLRAGSFPAALEHMSGSKEIRLLLIDLPVPEWVAVEIVKHSKDLQCGLRILVVSNTPGYRDTGADVYLPKGSDSPAEILDRVKILTKNKRGPKKRAKAADIDTVPRLNPLLRLG